MPFELINLLWLLLPAAVISGWAAGRRDALRQSGRRGDNARLPEAYLRGLNFLLNEQPDKAIEVFIQVLEVNSDTVETHLALGNLFRRRGEVERAIRIHQNLIARPTLDRNQRALALLELAQDYLKAGLFDRAENLLTELVENRLHSEQALRWLLHIYQQEKEWQQAIGTARRLARLTGQAMDDVIAHYHCEIAQLCVAANDLREARKETKKALTADPASVRASILLGDIEKAEHHDLEAIRAWQRVEAQDPQFMGEVAQRIADAFRRLNDEGGLYRYFEAALQRQGGVSLMLQLSNIVKDRDGIDAAERFVTEWLRRTPSVQGLQQLIDLNVLQAEGRAREDLELLGAIITRLGEQQQGYVCGHCGFKGRSLHWMCPSCHHWNTVKPVAEGGSLVS
jgi:lipopolysaccharide biosynthesis regulator YciM